MLQLQTFLAETKAALNSRGLVYIGEELNDGTALTPAHFLSPNTKTGTPQLGTEGGIKDPDNQESLSSKAPLLNTRKKGQYILQSFWKVWRNDYLLNLRDRIQIKLKSRCIELNVSLKLEILLNVKRASRGDHGKLQR